MVGAAIDHAPRSAVKTIYARPQGIDAVVRYGFMPVTEVAYPPP